MSAHTLYFAQHGLAVDKVDNPERPLSEAGIEQTIAMAMHLSRAGITINHIFHSGKLRAAETAEIFASNLNIPSTHMIDQMLPNDDVSLVTQHLNTENALYIGHLPHLEKLLSYLVTGKTTPNIIKLQNSAVACLEKKGNGYHIRWYLTADIEGN